MLAKEASVACFRQHLKKDLQLSRMNEEVGGPSRFETSSWLCGSLWPWHQWGLLCHQILQAHSVWVCLEGKTKSHWRFVVSVGLMLLGAQDGIPNESRVCVVTLPFVSERLLYVVLSGQGTPCICNSHQGGILDFILRMSPSLQSWICGM